MSKQIQTKKLERARKYNWLLHQIASVRGLSIPPDLPGISMETRQAIHYFNYWGRELTLALKRDHELQIINEYSRKD